MTVSWRLLSLCLVLSFSTLASHSAQAFDTTALSKGAQPAAPDAVAPRAPFVLKARRGDSPPAASPAAVAQVSKDCPSTKPITKGPAPTQWTSAECGPATGRPLPEGAATAAGIEAALD